MTAMRRAAILRLASSAHEMDLDVMSGILSKDEHERWHVGPHDLEEWLSAHESEELVLVLASLMDERPVKIRSCGTCGRDYADVECPHCRASRLRLRGSA